MRGREWWLPASPASGDTLGGIKYTRRQTEKAVLLPSIPRAGQQKWLKQPMMYVKIKHFFPEGSNKAGDTTVQLHCGPWRVPCGPRKGKSRRQAWLTCPLLSSEVGLPPSSEWTKNGDVVPEEMLRQRTYTHGPGEADGPGHVGWKVKAKQTGSWDGNKPQGF